MAQGWRGRWTPDGGMTMLVSILHDLLLAGTQLPVGWRLPADLTFIRIRGLGLWLRMLNVR